MHRNHDRSVLLANVLDVIYVVDQLPCAIFWKAGYRTFVPEVRYKQQAYAGVSRACLESTLMSLRCLDEFFRSGGRDDDIRAEDYPGFQHVGGFLSDEKRERINKHIAHFTVQRATNRVLFWSYRKEIVDATLTTVRFLDYLISTFLNLEDPVLPRVKELHGSLRFFVLELGVMMDLEVKEE